eukprot:246561_1
MVYLLSDRFFIASVPMCFTLDLACCLLFRVLFVDIKLCILVLRFPNISMCILAIYWRKHWRNSFINGSVLIQISDNRSMRLLDLLPCVSDPLDRNPDKSIHAMIM